VHVHASLAEHFSDQEIANAGASVTAVRVENFPASARYRSSRLKQMLQAYAPALELDTARSRIFWNEVRALRMFEKSSRPLWRISTPPATAPKLVSAVTRKIDVRVLYDWSGGLIWLETPPISDAGAVEIRRTLAEFGGHATLIRAEAQARAVIDVFQPLDPPLMALTQSLKRAFDPVGILNPGRMYPGV
jgi:glycolate oxidase FAD binding subunit